MFPKYQSQSQWSLYTEFYGNVFTGKHIAWSALGDGSILASMMVMWMILLIDSLLKIAATKSSLELEFDVRKEILTTGIENVIAAFAGVSSPGYPLR